VAGLAGVEAEGPGDPGGGHPGGAGAPAHRASTSMGWAMGDGRGAVMPATEPWARGGTLESEALQAVWQAARALTAADRRPLRAGASRWHPSRRLQARDNALQSWPRRRCGVG
ncbi:MAG: hypothetical protein OXT09_01865, partial [Myxococcales bacterium]|nr:hypothetical protein [Myxococcales bacterium]